MASTLDVLDSDNVLNRGTIANDNTGDTLRTAGLKINRQFEAVDSAMYNTTWVVWPEGSGENHSTLRYNGSKLVGTNNFTVDSDANTTIAGTLDVGGATTLSSTLDITGATTIGDSLDVSGDLTASGDLTITGAAVINGGLTMDTDKFTVADTTGNTAIAGTLDVGGATGIDGDFDINADKFTVASATGNTTVAGTLDVTGATTFNADVDLQDNDKLKLGSGDDLQIYHDGSNSNSYISEGGTGSLILKSNRYSLRNAADTEQIMTAGEDSSVALYYDNVKRLETTSTGVTVNGDLSVTSGNIGGYERILAAYANLSTSTQIVGNNVTEGNFGFGTSDNWGAVPVNTGGLTCTTSTPVRDLFQIGTASHDDVYIVKLAFRLYNDDADTNDDIRLGMKLFGKYLRADLYLEGGNTPATTTQEFVVSAAFTGAEIVANGADTLNDGFANGGSNDNSNNKVGSDHKHLFDTDGGEESRKHPWEFSVINLVSLSDGDGNAGDPTTSWSLTGGNAANFAIEVYRNANNRISQLTELPTTGAFGGN
jgi:hypothetical protein